MEDKKVELEDLDGTKMLFLNVRFSLPDDFDGDLNDAIAHMLDYRLNKGAVKPIPFVDYNANNIDDEYWYMLLNNVNEEEKKRLHGGVGLFQYNSEKRCWDDITLIQKDEE